ncbi:MAG: hypothetical protein NZ551_04945 [Microscillaceae bacterium]|nr:hypothetical protein [Microscillaceae bacterium]MDW8460541.1 hypothetical protein [Cytophagales bacterium]
MFYFPSAGIIKYKFVIIGLICSFYTFTLAQEKSLSFWFPKPNSQEAEYYQTPLNKLKPFLANPDLNEKKHLIKALYSQAIDTTDYYFAVRSLLEGYTFYQRKNIAEEIQEDLKIKDEKIRLRLYEVITDTLPKYSIWEENYFTLLDFDHDGHTDMVIIPRVYFGPVLGFACYGYQNGTFEYIFDNVGEFVSVEQKNNVVTLRFLVIPTNFDETFAVLSIQYHINKESTFFDNKLVYTSQTLIPSDVSYQSLYTFEVIVDTLYLRANPSKLTETITSKNSDKTELIATLRGNITAEFNRNATGFVLAETNDWAFVCIKKRNGSTILENTPDLSPKKYYQLCRIAEQTFQCGWVQKNQIRAKK